MKNVLNYKKNIIRKKKNIIMKRLCLYLTYDKQNIVDRYIGYMLQELHTCVDEIVVICNEIEISRGKEILEKYADKIFLRENIGLDVGGFKDALCNLIGWKKVLEYDELILVNDSFFGPFSPMKNIFDMMDDIAADFWGLTKHAEWTSGEKSYFPEHVQSFFIAIRKNMLHSKEFREYWSEMPYYSSYDEVVIKHEKTFTEYFCKQGFTCACYADVEANNSDNKQNNFNQYFVLAYEMIRKRNFPFFKKQQLACKTMDMYTQENQMLAIDYIDKETDYDVDMIWENIIRTIDASDLYANLHLHFILEDKGGIIQEEKPNIGIIVFVFYEKSVEYIQEYLHVLRNKYNIIICSSNKNLLEKYKAYNCILIKEDEGYNDIISNLSGLKYVCIIHDEDMTGDVNPSYIGKSCFYNRWENLVKSDKHIQEIVGLFERQKWLGFLAPPMLYFNKYFGNVGEEWGEMFQTIKEQIDYLGIKNILQYSKRSFAITKSFWIRTNILKSLYKYKDIDYNILPYLWIYIVQDAGYYSGIVESVAYASMNIVNLQHYLNVMGDQIRRQYGCFELLSDFKKHILHGAIEIFCSKYKHLYVYGVGAMERKYRIMFAEIEAYVVSDGQIKEPEVNGKKVIYLSEVKCEKDVGFIVCLNEKNRECAVQMLQERGFLNYICI